MENIEELKAEVEAWAVEVGQDTVAIEITRQFFIVGGDPNIRLRETAQGGVADWKAIYNNRQQIFRWLRSDSKASSRKVKALAPAIREALPAERRARLGGGSVQHLVCVAIREFSTAIISVLLNDRDISRQLTAANTALAAMEPALHQRRLTTALSRQDQC
ncbi:toxin YdaT family protein [Brenneria tiliae]|uniref:toxin YdaT family protein n=1 Tax=Brenneria tiliae TaxID=2914984 RepID=UPI002014D72F|nr:toxin YdaT family protein [Brenneria tiliae]MCL2899762.1 toxin YdaT domain-containing protein [Brenneria tiliae]MCL2904749.1 toxin YdaT domain-containing protein [Brenneria tiliae]